MTPSHIRDHPHNRDDQKEPAVEIKIGVQDTTREVALDSADTVESVTAAAKAAIEGGTLLSLTDDRGRTVLVPGAKIAYVEIGAPSSRRVGFGS